MRPIARKPGKGGCRLFSTIRSRLILLLLVVMIPLLIVQGGIYYGRYHSQCNRELQSNLELARAVGQTFAQFVNDVLHQEQAIGIALTLPQITETEQMNRILKMNEAANPAIEYFNWVSPQGVILASTRQEAIGRNVGDRSHIRQVIAGRDWVTSDVLRSRITGRSAFVVCRAVRNGKGFLVGVVLAAINPVKLGTVLSIQHAGQGALSIIDTQGVTVYRHPEMPRTEEKCKCVGTDPINTALKGKEVALSTDHTCTGKRRLMAFVPILGIGWVAKSCCPEAEITMPVFSDLCRDTGIFLLVAGMAIAAAAVLSRTISKPIEILQAHALAFACGDLVPLPEVTGPVEIRDLFRACQAMKDEIRKKTVQIEKSEQQYRTLVETMNEGLETTDENGIITYVNDKLCQMLGYTRDELLGRSPFDFLNTIDRQRCEAQMNQSRHGERSSDETEVITKSGKKLPVIVSVAPVLDESGAFRGTIAVFADVGALKQAQEALRSERDFAEGLIETAQAIILLLDVEGRIVRFNPYMEEISGYSLEEVKGKNWFTTFLPERDRHCIRDVFARSLKGIQTRGNTNPIVAKDGREREIEWHDTVLKDDQGEPAALLCIGHDVTERRKAEEALRAGEERYRTIVETTTEGIWMLNNEHRTLYVNTRMAAMLGYEIEEMIGCDPRSLVDPSRQSELEMHLAKRREGIREKYEICYRRKDGSLFWGLFSATPLFDDGQYKGTFAMIADVTQRKEAEEAVKAEHEFRKSIENSILSGIVAVDLDGRQIYVNPAFCKMVGWDQDELIGLKPPFPYWPPEEAVPLAQSLDAVLKGKPYTLERRFRRRNGEIFEALVLPSPLRDSNGNLTGYLASIGDITERKRLERTLQDSGERLKYLSSELLRSQEEERRRIALELHDSISSSLYGIKLSVESTLREIEQDTRLSEPLKRAVSMIQGTGEELRRIIGELRPSVLDDLGVLAAVSWLCRQFSAVHSGIRIEKELSIDENDIPKDHKTVVFRIVQEALHNIAKHSRAESINVALRKRDDVLELEIRDNGIGFELDSALADKKGLGLTSMTERAKLSGGEFFIETAPGLGATLRATWPLAEVFPEQVIGRPTGYM